MPKNAYVPDIGRYILRLAYDGSGNLEYQGKADPGSATSSAVWWIVQFYYDGGGNLTHVLCADGNTEFDNVWDDRASLSYS